MKKILSSVFSAILCLAFCFSAVACNKEVPAVDDSNSTITVGASSAPHAEILEFVKPILAEQNYTLKIVTFDDYILPNEGVADGSLDANYFQHAPYLNSYNQEKKSNIVSIGKIHYEPFGLFGNGIDLANVPSGTTVFVPSDDSNCTRALYLLAQAELITLPNDASIEEGVSVLDITNDNGLHIVPVEASTLPAQLKANTGALACINGNYAISAGIDLSTALALENADGAAANLYGNIIATRKGSENSVKLKALVDALLSQEVASWIETKYAGAVKSLAQN
jgi:D-methionine transport system substrate-binding protein